MYQSFSKLYIKNNEEINSQLEDFNINPAVWGSHFWKSLHYSAVGYENNPSNLVKQKMKDRINALPYEIPCASCRIHCNLFIENYDLNNAVENRKNLFLFYFTFHNAVNKRLHKQEMLLEDVIKMYNF